MATQAEVRRLERELAHEEEKVLILRATVAAAMNQGVEMMVAEYKDRWADPAMVTAENEAARRAEAQELMAMKVAREVRPFTHHGGGASTVPSAVAESVLADMVCTKDDSFAELAEAQRIEMGRRGWHAFNFGAYVRGRLLDLQVALKDGRWRGDYKRYETGRLYFGEVAALEARLEE